MRRDKLAALVAETGARAFALRCRARGRGVAKLFDDVERAAGAPDVVVYNASFRARGPFVDLVPADVEKAIRVSAFGGFLVAQQAAKRMLPKGRARSCSPAPRASVKGYAQSAPFAMGKFALRGLAQSPRGNCSRAAFMWRISSSMAESAGKRRPQSDPAKPDALLDPDVRSPRVACMCRSSHAAPGRPRSNCGRGSRTSTKLIQI